MAKHNMVACRHSEYGMMIIRCNKVYVNDVRAVNSWCDEHEQVLPIPFEHGCVYMAKYGENIVSIYCCDKVRVASMGDEAVWFIE